MHPDYLHVLLNPIPVYGLAMGIIALLVAFALRSRPARVVRADPHLPQCRGRVAGLALWRKGV